MKKTKKIFIFFAAFFCVFSFVLLYAFLLQSSYVYSYGYLEGRQVQVCPENEGKILFSHVKEGDFVEKGQVLFQLDDRIDQSQKKQVLAKFTQVKKVADLAKKEFDVCMEDYLSQRRKKDIGLIDQEELVASLKDLEEKKSVFEEAKNALFLEEMQLECMDQKLSQKKIVAPFEGVITKCHFSKGSFVDKKDPVLCLFDAKQIWAYAHVEENDIHRIKIGSKALVTLPAYPKNTLEGEIEFISPTVKEINQKKMIPIKIAIVSSSISNEAFICNGMSANIKIQSEP